MTRLAVAWRSVPVVWRRAVVATAVLWLVATVVVVAATGTLPANDPTVVPATDGFRGWQPPPTNAAGTELVRTGLVRFDALWYLAIAADGYPTTTAVPQAAAFFPGYPLLVAALGALLGGRLVLAATVVSLLSCVAALAGLQRLAQVVVASAEPEPAGGHDLAGDLAGGIDDATHGDARDDVVARRTVLVAVTFPTAFFLVAPYAEPLFLACAVWSLVLATRDRVLLATLLAAAATLVRPVGALLVVPLALGVIGSAGWWPGDLRAVVRRALPAVGVATALGLLAVVGQVRWDDPLAVVHAQAAWQRGLTAPWISAWDAVRFALGDLGAGFTGYHLLDLLVVGVAGWGVVALARLRQWPLVLHAVANLGLWLTQAFPSRPLLSAPRFALVVPAVLLGLAAATRRATVERAWLPLAGVLFGIHLTLFTRWWFVF